MRVPCKEKVTKYDGEGKKEKTPKSNIEERRSLRTSERNIESRLHTDSFCDAIWGYQLNEMHLNLDRVWLRPQALSIEWRFVGYSPRLTHRQL